jgi:disulfide bond formation protein DsbB
MTISSYRLTNLVAAGGCGLLIVIAVFYFQNQLGLEPCYLCMTQRVFVMAVGLIFLLATLHNPAGKGRSIYSVLTITTSLGGAFFSVKQLWLQSLPEDQIPACGPPVEYLFDAFSASEAISMLLRGDGNCAEIQWQLLGLSMPAWVLVSFTLLTGLGLLQLLRRA